MSTRKFMQTLDNKHYVELEVIARKRGITLQQLVRAVVVPEWMDGRVRERPPERRRRSRFRSRRSRLAPMVTA